MKHNEGPFPLFSEDLRPSNVLARSPSEVTAVIDWESCYAAPAEFTYCSTWWLILVHPLMWDDGFKDWFEHYMQKHEVFLDVLRECKDETEQEAKAPKARLSDHTRESMQNGHFWFWLAARTGFAFDEIYWECLDPVFYGDFTSIEDRMSLLDPDERDAMEPFVQIKMEQMAECKLD
ncbi:hypothetical protein MMC25_007982 [Agyrium rufum]|nr:hypothetical protein [Agyrium rufum]